MNQDRPPDVSRAGRSVRCTPQGVSSGRRGCINSFFFEEVARDMFQCPNCRSVPNSLRIQRTIALPSDSRSDEISLQILRCKGCGFRAVAVYEESRRGSLGSESWSHQGFELALPDLQAIRRMIRACPDDSNPRCTCPSHQVLGRRDRSGRWEGLGGMSIQRSFNLHR